MKMNHWLLLFSTILVLSISTARSSLPTSDRCLAPELKSNWMKPSTLPAGRALAGHFRLSKDPVDNAAACARACCKEPATVCQAAYFRSGRCYLIQCQSMDSCLPVSASKAQAADAVTVLLRFIPQQSVAKGTPNQDPSEQNNEQPRNNNKNNEADDGDSDDDEDEEKELRDPYERPCVYGVAETNCRRGEVCHTRTEKSRGGVCRCSGTLVRDPTQGGLCVPPRRPDQSSDGNKNTSTDVTPKPATFDRPCKTTSGDCEADRELCVKGICRCRPEFRKDPTQPAGSCIPWVLVPASAVTNASSTATGTTASSTRKPAVSTTVKPQPSTRPSKQARKPSVSTTVKPQPSTRPSKPVPGHPVQTKPIANAGGPRTVQLPLNLVTLDGSRSTSGGSGGPPLVGYLWSRLPDSLAAGQILNGSESKAVLWLTGLVPGHYRFQLTVTNAGGKSAKDVANLVVVGAAEHHLLELYLATDISFFTKENQLNLISQLELLLRKSIHGYHLHIIVESVFEDYSTGNMVVLLYAVNDQRSVILPALSVLAHLKPLLLETRGVLDFPMVKIDTKVCQYNCSGHGRCQEHTKTCVCDSDWVSNPLLLHYYNLPNCDLRLSVVISIAVGSVMGVVMVLLLCCYCRRRCRQSKSTYGNPHMGYIPVDHSYSADEEDNELVMDTKQRNGVIDSGGQAVKQVLKGSNKRPKPLTIPRPLHKPTTDKTQLRPSDGSKNSLSNASSEDDNVVYVRPGVSKNIPPTGANLVQST